jgi:hypothetical protein
VAAADEPPKQQTWNDARAIAKHRGMSAAECLVAAISLSRAALSFADAKRDDG